VGVFSTFSLSGNKKAEGKWSIPARLFQSMQIYNEKMLSVLANYEWVSHQQQELWLVMFSLPSCSC